MVRPIGIGLIALWSLWAITPVRAQAPGRAPERWRLVEMWRSGGDPTLDVSFGSVADLEVAANGQLLVLTRGRSPRLVWVNNTGDPVRAIGGTHAPPLLHAPNGIAQFPDGRIVINDPEVGRFVIVSDTGTFIREIDYQPWGWTVQWLGFVGPGGALFDPVADGPRLVWRRWAPDFSASQLLPALPCDVGLVRADPGTTFHVDGTAGRAAIPVPFAQPPIALARAADGSTWSGIAPDYRRIVHTAWRRCDDAPPAIVLAGEPLPVPDEARQAAIDQIEQIAIDVGAPVLPDLDRLPATQPLFHALRIDRQQRLWVERLTASGDAHAFSVFDPDGRPRAAIATIPVTIDTTRPVTFSDNQLFVFTTDDSGWTWLVALRIERIG